MAMMARSNEGVNKTELRKDKHFLGERMSYVQISFRLQMEEFLKFKNSFLARKFKFTLLFH